MSKNNDDMSFELKRRLEETRLPADQKERILAQLPLPEERERLFRQLQEHGGLSSEQFLAALNGRDGLNANEARVVFGRLIEDAVVYCQALPDLVPNETVEGITPPLPTSGQHRIPGGPCE